MAKQDIVKQIHKATRSRFLAEEKNRIILEGLRGQISVSGLCRKERIAPSIYYKWSRENGAIAYKVLNIDIDTPSDTTTVTLDHLSQDVSDSLKPQDWVEVLDDYCVLEARPGSMLQVKQIDGTSLRVVLQGLCSESIINDLSRVCLMRRWDQKQSNGSQIQDGAVTIEEGLSENSWVDLEHGIRIRFDPGGEYHTGDYWLIPARTQTGSIEWPYSDESPIAKPPFGICHHFAPLSIINIDARGKVSVRDCRLAFRPKLQRPVVVRRKP